MRQLLLGEPVAARRVQQELLVHIAIPEPLRERRADFGASRAHLMRDDDDGHGSPPPVLLFERRRRDRDPRAADVVQAVQLVRERSAREYLEDLERRLERGRRTLVHYLLDGGAGASRPDAPRDISARRTPRPPRPASPRAHTG